MWCHFELWFMFLFSLLHVTFCKEWVNLMFAQQWVTSTCLEYPTHGCNIFPNVTSWTVHGVWASDKNGEPIDDCGGAPFDINKLEAILPSLYKNWVSTFTDQTVYKFLKHEWTKHGSCVVGTPPFKNELDYFSIGLRMLKDYDVYLALLSDGIIPSVTNQYTFKSINNSLVKAFKVTPKITCTDTDKSKRALYQIKVCLDHQLKPVSCSSGTNCPAKGLWYLPLHPAKPIDYRVVVGVVSVIIVGIIIGIIVWKCVRKRRAGYAELGVSSN